jgi:hypothetical protein
MSLGYGKVQWGCLRAIADAERKGEPPPTTFDVAIETYYIHPDDDGYYTVSAAQHVAVKRALGGLQRQGKVIGIDKLCCRTDYSRDGRSERTLCWMTEKRAQQWVRENPGRYQWVRDKMREIGMQVKP